MIDLVSWVGMILVVGAVWFWSQGRAKIGNWVCLASVYPWIAVGLWTDNYALIALQLILGGKAVYELSRKDEDE